MNNNRFKKKKQDPWCPGMRNCCRNKINNGIESEEKFCGDPTCENFIGVNNMVFFEDWMEEYYDWRLANETDYERSDEELPGKLDRVWLKFEKQKETEDCYSGLYMLEEFRKMITSLHYLSTCDKQDLKWLLRNEIRDDYRYKITKLQFKSLMAKYMERDQLEISNNNGWHLYGVFHKEEIIKESK